MSNIGLVYLVLLLVACTNWERDFTNFEPDSILLQVNNETKIVSHSTISGDSIRMQNYNTIREVLLEYKLDVYIEEYDAFSCSPVLIDESIGDFEVPVSLGDMLGNGTEIFTFVLPQLNFCEEGQSYYFSNSDIPRLYTDSECCHPNSLFVIGDIDEDGISEIGQYYSSCSSRYKSLVVYTLKNNLWKSIGRCTYDLRYSEYQASKFHKYVRKVDLGIFEMLEITDIGEAHFEGKPNWIKFEM